jgi:hypothetical protein
MSVEQILLDLGLEADVKSVTCARKTAKDGKVYFVDVDGVHTFTAASIKRYVEEQLVTVAKEGENFVFTANDGCRLVKVGSDSFSGFTNKGTVGVSDIQFA